MSEIKKIKLLAKTIKGPAGNPVSLKVKIPKKEDSPPMIIAPKAYWDKFRLRFLAVEAGIATKAAVKRPPTIFTPKATMAATQPKRQPLRDVADLQLLCPLYFSLIR